VSEKEYKHWIWCNANRNKPAGEPGTICCCFNAKAEEMLAALRPATAPAPADVRPRFSLEEEKRLVSELSTAAAMFTMEYQQAKENGGHLDHGLDSVLKPIVRNAIVRNAMPRPATATAPAPAEPHNRFGVTGRLPDAPLGQATKSWPTSSKGAKP
jgi:hypothetical protein